MRSSLPFPLVEVWFYVYVGVCKYIARIPPLIHEKIESKRGRAQTPSGSRNACSALYSAVPKSLSVKIVKQPLFIVALVALAIQSLYILESNRHLAFQLPVVDSVTYHKLAVSLIGDNAAAGRAFWRPPLYPYVLSIVYRLFDSNLLATRLVHGLFGVVSAMIVYIVALRFMRTRPALVTALLFCFYGPLLFFFSQLLPAGLAVLLGLIALWMTLRFVEAPARGRALACGIAYGVAALNVPNILICAAVPLGWILLQVRRGSARSTRSTHAALVALGVLICILPVTVHNIRASKQFVLISTNAGVNLYVGNNPDMDSTISARPGLDWDRIVAMPYSHGIASGPDAQRYFYREVLKYAVQHPVNFLKDILVKTGYLLEASEIPRNISVYPFRDQSPILYPLVWRIPGTAFPFGVVGALGLVGLVTTMRRDSAHIVLACFVLAYGASIILFFPTARYRIPVLPGVLILAVLGAQVLHARWKQGGRARVISAVLLVAALLIVNWPRSLPTNNVNFKAELYTFLGVGLQVRERTEEALDYYDRALAIDPDYVDAYYYTGTALRELDRNEDAWWAFRHALDERNDHDKAMHELAVMLYEQGEPERAVAMLRRVLEINPHHQMAMRNLATGLLSLEQVEEASHWIERVRQIMPAGISSN
jgi:4-amino-4-deoxy-L-arabinose transferase-like glycosyltransferase